MSEEERLIKTIGADVETHDTLIDGLCIHYVTAGQGQPLLLIHGATMGWGQWYPNIAELAKFFSVYALDLPGSGRSSEVDFQKADLEVVFVEIVGEFVKRMGWQKVHIIGHSIGGWVALKLAMEHPDVIDKIVLVSPLGFSRYVPWRFRILSFYFIAKMLSKTVMRPGGETMRKFLYSVLDDAAVLADEFIDYFYGNIKRSPMSHPFLFVSSLQRYFRMRDELYLLKNLSGIEKQILIIAGADDPLIPLNKTFKAFALLPRAHTEIFFDTGHVAPIERSQQFNSLVVNFLGKSQLRY